MCESVRKTYANEQGELPSYAWPGGYPIFYLTADNGMLCPDCANCPECRNADVEYPSDDQWRIVATGINWEDTALYCDHCNNHIESAYGDDIERYQKGIKQIG